MDIRKLNSILMRTVAVLLMLVLVTSGMVSGRFARYVTTAEYSDSARVAKFHVVDTSSPMFGEVNIPVTLITPGNITTSGISLKNHSEVAVQFTITVENVYDNLPLSFQIRDQDKQVLAQMGEDENSVTYTGTIAPGQNNKAFSLFVGWPYSESNLDYCGRVDLIRVAVKAEQVD